MRTRHVGGRLQRGHAQSGTLHDSRARQGHHRCCGRTQLVVGAHIQRHACVSYRVLDGVLRVFYTTCSKEDKMRFGIFINPQLDLSSVAAQKRTFH